MNILVLMTDQQRFDALGCAGNPIVRTPNLDALAARGVRFSQACCPTPICVASRQSLITGHRAGRTRWVANHALPGPLPEWPTVMTLLHRAGYHTHAVGKMHFGGRHYGLEVHERMEECRHVRIDDDYLVYLKRQGVRTRYPQGLRDLLYYQPQTCGIPEEHSQNSWVAKRSIECLRQHKRHRGDQPLFLWSSWIAPHPPYAPCEPYDSMYDPAEMPPPVNAERPIEDLPSPAWPHRARLDGAHLDAERIRRIRALYYGQISHVDAAIGRVLAELDELGLCKNTAVFFVSDHGDMLGDHGLSQKNVPHEPSVRVPMILHWPGRTAEGAVCDDLAGLTDLFPTLLDGLTLTYPDELPRLPGASLLGREGGGLREPRDAYFIDYGNGRERWICLRTATHKYALWAAGGKEELYDLREDPDEIHNIADEESGLAREMRGRVLEWEQGNGLPASFQNGAFKQYSEPVPPTEDGVRRVMLNEGRWADNLPSDEKDGVESFVEAFTRAIAEETSLTPDKLSLSDYRSRNGTPLSGTPWEDAWNRAKQR